MIKVKEYNFAYEIVKVDLSVGPTYSSLATIKRVNGQTRQAGELSHGPTHSKTLRSQQSLFGILQLGVINVYTFRPINICFISRLNQDSLTLPYTRQTPPHLTPSFLPPPKKKKNIHNIISFADRKLGQMHRLTVPMLWILLYCESDFHLGQLGQL